MIPRVNITMVTYNRLKDTSKSLPNIIETASDSVPFVMSVVDNGSLDGTPKYLMDLFEQKKIHNLLLLDKNIGVAKAHNIMWKLCDYDYYAKMDNDVTFTKKNWMTDIINVLDQSPEIGALGYNCESIKNYPIMRDLYRKKIGNIGGACFFVSRQVHEVLGYWCEDYDLYGEEDADYGMRIQNAGFLNAYMIDQECMLHENEDPTDEYRQFKNKQREENLIRGGIWYKNLSDYSRKINLYRASNQLEIYRKKIMRSVI